MENRIIAGTPQYYSQPTFTYSYAPGNKRVWRGVWDSPGGTQTVDEVTFWGVNGQKLATYAMSVWQQTPQWNTQPYLLATQTGTEYYFGGKLIKNAGYVTPDRLGSIGKYFPYGQERPSATQDGTDKFATYFRDSETGLDYADQRYHQPGMGRFMTPDRMAGSARLPASWNKYAYSGGDPVNHADPGGNHWVCIAGVNGEPDDCFDNGTGDCVGSICPLIDYPDNSTEVQSCLIAVMVQDWNYYSTHCTQQGGGGDGSLPFKPKTIPTLQFGQSIVGLFNKAFSSAWDALSKPACAQDFATSTAGLQSFLGGASYQYFPVFVTDLTSPNYGKPDPTKDAVTNPNTQLVTINNAGNFGNYAPDATFTETKLGQSATLTGDQLRVYELLHELGHLAGLGTTPDANNYDNAFNKSIIQDCLGIKFK